MVGKIWKYDGPLISYSNIHHNSIFFLIITSPFLEASWELLGASRGALEPLLAPKMTPKSTHAHANAQAHGAHARVTCTQTVPPMHTTTRNDTPKASKNKCETLPNMSDLGSPNPPKMEPKSNPKRIKKQRKKQTEKSTQKKELKALLGRSWVT